MHVFDINGFRVQSYTDENGAYALDAATLLVALGLQESLATTMCNNPFYTYYTFQRVGIKPYLIYVKWSVPQMLHQLVYLQYITLEESVTFIETIKHAKPFRAEIHDRQSPIRII